MCGLVGMAGDIDFQKRQVFRDLLDVCQVRGRDSTGVIRVDKDLNYGFAKEIGPPSYLAETKRFDRLMTGDCTVLIGHTRSKTSGEVSRENAHPFDYPEEGIIGVHNGTLRNYTHLEGHTHKKVDSDVLYGHLAKNGPQETFGNLFGAWACVWWDNNEKTLNFIRNDERPLYFTWSKDMKAMFWASEIWMFSAISRRIELWAGEEGESPFYPLPVNKLWRFTPIVTNVKDEPRLKMKTPIEIEPKKTSVQTWTGPNQRTGSGAGGAKTGAWHQNSSGDWTREGSSGGGEVANPFHLARETILAHLLELQGELDDPLPWEDDIILDRARVCHELNSSNEGRPLNKPATPPEETNTPISNVAFLTHSASRKASLKASTATSDSPRKILSLPGTNSRPSRQTPNAASSNSSGESSPRLAVQRQLRGVSFRTVAGIDYITNNVTGSEYPVVEFTHATGGCCTFCKHPVESLREVGTILSKQAFICKSCLVRPKDEVVNS